MILVLVTLGLIGLFQTLGAYNELRSAKDLLVAAKDSLASRDIAAASDQFAAAQDHVNNANARLRGHALTVGFVRIIPYAGTQVRALDDFVQVGSHLSQAGVLLTGAVSGIPGLDAGSTAGKPSIGQMVDLMTQLSPQLMPVEQELQAAQAASNALSTRWLIGSAVRLKAELDDKLNSAVDDVQKARQLTMVFPAIMGAPGLAPKRYLLVQADNFESRPAGGLMATYGVLETTHDSMAVTEYERAPIGLPVGLVAPGIPPWPLDGINPALRFWDAGWWPDFPETTGVLAQIWSLNGKAPVDGYISIDPVAIQYMLEQLGPLDLPDFGEVVTADNLPELVLHYYDVDKNVAFLKSLAANFFQRLIQSDPSEWFQLGSAFGQSLTEKHMLLVFNDPQVEQTFTAFGWSGEVSQANSDYLMAIDANIFGNFPGYKANMWIKHSLQVDITREENSTLVHRITFTLDNSAGASDYSSLVELYVPAEAISSPDPDLKDLGLDSGKRVLGKGVQVPIGQVASLTFEYTTPAYSSMSVQKQSGQANMPVRVSFVGGKDRSTVDFELVNGREVSLP